MAKKNIPLAPLFQFLEGGKDPILEHFYVIGITREMPNWGYSWMDCVSKFRSSADFLLQTAEIKKKRSLRNRPF